MEYKGAHILSCDQFDRAGLQKLFALASEVETLAKRARRSKALAGAVLGNLFFEPSTRSRISFGAAFARLGGVVLDTTGFQFSSMAKGESIEDTSRVVSGYVDVIVVRHSLEGSVDRFASVTNVPVINGGDGVGEHPAQALLDVYTIGKELGRSDGIRIALVGDLLYGRTVHSLIRLLSLYDKLEFVLISPAALRMPEDLVKRVLARGHIVTETDDLEKGVAEVDVIYMTRVQQERFAVEGGLEKYQARFRLDRAVFERCCRPDAIVLHPLPRDHRTGGNELSTDLDTLPNLGIFRQTDNGIPIRMALFSLVLGVEDRLLETEPVHWYVPGQIRRL